MIRKPVLFACAVATLAGVACTPNQLASWQAHTGITLTPEQQAPLLALDDVPYRNGRLSIAVDGTVTETACPDPAPPEAHYWYDLTAARQTYRAVTCARGWTPDRTAAWEQFVVDDVIQGESGGCWNIRRGGRIAMGEPGCPIIRQGRHSDTGYGQVIALHYRANGNHGSGWLCAQEGLCSADDIIATPSASMTALVALVERSGKQPWCFSARVRRLHWAC
jgi:hypothetical protein